MASCVSSKHCGVNVGWLVYLSPLSLKRETKRSTSGKIAVLATSQPPHQYPFDVFPFNPAVISLNVILVFPSLTEFDFSAHVLQYAVFLPDMIHTQ